jgi:SAM-dependent methyltransferase
MASPAWLARTVASLRYRGRNLRFRKMFEELGTMRLGTVLDVGGGQVADLAVRRLNFDRWTVVELDPTRFPVSPDRRVDRVLGDGTRLPVASATFDTVLSIQVLEHVFEPLAVVEELRRVTRPGGRIVVVVPQTANVHELPSHYQNFTRHWLHEAARRLELETVSYLPLGGAWSTVASRLLFQYASVLRVPGHHDPDARRGPLFWALAPLGLVVSIVVFPLAMLLSLADLDEEANNHLVVLRVPD